MSAQNPYVGPRSFLDGERLYGRDDEARRVFDLLLAERVVLLYSPSGAGKTSLIQARLTPKLREEDFRVLPTIRVNATCPGLDAETANRYVVATLLSLEKAFPAGEQLPVEQLVSLDLVTYLKQRYPDRNHPVALVFDQFEELLTLDPTDATAKRAFLLQVGAVLREPCYWALFAMREDYIAALDGYAHALPTRLCNRFRLDFLDQVHAAEAIRKPAKDCDVDFTAAEKLAADLSQIRVQQLDGTVAPKAGGPVEPVQLQVVCRRIWEKPRKKPDEIGEEDLSVSGTSDVDPALAEYYEERLQAIARDTAVPERAIREWFGKLITERGTRGQVLRGAEATAGLDNHVIDALAHDYLIRSEERRGATWYELAHDRLVEPIRSSNAAWQQKNLGFVQAAAFLWASAGGPLWKGDELVAAERWAKENPGQVEERERAFLTASLGVLSDFERAVVEWEVGGRQPDQLLRGNALEAAVLTHRGAGDDAFTSSELAFLRRSLRERRRERNGKLLVSGLVAALVVLLGAAVRVIVTQRKFVDESQRGQILTARLNKAIVENNALEASSRAALRPYTLSDAATSTQINVKERLQAQARVATLLPQVKQQTAKTSILYFAKPDDGKKLAAALHDLSIPIDTVPGKTSNATNAIWYGADVPESDVKLVAYALIRAGVALQGIQKMSDDYLERNPQYRTVIQIGRDPSLADQPPFTLDMLDKSSVSDLHRHQAHDDGTQLGQVLTFNPQTSEGTVKLAGSEDAVPFQAPSPAVAFTPGDPVSFELFTRRISEPKGRYADNVRVTQRPVLGRVVPYGEAPPPPKSPPNR